MAAWGGSFFPFGMNWYDAVVVLAVVYGVWSGVRTGFSGEIIRAVGLVMMVVLAVGFYPPAGAWLKDRMDWDSDRANLVAFIAVAVIAFIITLIAQTIVHKRRRGRVFSALVENMLGGVAGALRMLVIMIWLTVLLCLVRSPWWHKQIARQSRSGAWLVDHLPAVAAVVDKQFPESLWFLGNIKRPQEPDVPQN